ncbi:MAG: hypothetical protein FWD55_07885 [Propionibacteriaceae bacterium]|nr:hypothetical protein [Propionibacteriaceae bacterium]
MCHYITASLAGISVDELNTVLLKNGDRVSFSLAVNQHVQAFLNPGEVYLVHNASTCDCGTELGKAAQSYPNENASSPDSVERDLAKLRAKGWGEEKIRRWLAEKQLAAEHAGQANLVRQQVLNESGWHGVQQWVDVITTAIELAGAKSFGLLLHWYSGPLSERMSVTRRDFPLTDLGVELLAHMPEDTLYAFSNGKNQDFYI